MLVINYINSNTGSTDVTTIQFSDEAITVTGNGASVDDNVVTISQSGTYRLSGTATDTRLVVNAAATDEVNLQLSGLNLTSATYAPLYVASAGTTVIDLLQGTTNSLTDAASYVLVDAAEPDGALFSHDDLIISGSGALAINANYKMGIVSKDDLTINGGNLTVNAKDIAIRGRDSVEISGGTITITSGNDGIQSNNDEDATKGTIEISGGTISITSAKDGIQAETNLTVSGGSINATATGKGLTAGGDLLVAGGTTAVTNNTSAGRGLDADGDIAFTGGITTIALSGTTVLAASGSGSKASHPTGVKSNGNISVSGTASVAVTGTSTATGARRLSVSDGISVGGGRVTTDLAGAGAAYVNASGVQDAYRSAGLVCWPAMKIIHSSQLPSGIDLYDAGMGQTTPQL